MSIILLVQYRIGSLGSLTTGASGGLGWRLDKNKIKQVFRCYQMHWSDNPTCSINQVIQYCTPVCCVNFDIHTLDGWVI